MKRIKSNKFSVKIFFFLLKSYHINMNTIVIQVFTLWMTNDLRAGTIFYSHGNISTEEKRVGMLMELL